MSRCGWPVCIQAPSSENIVSGENDLAPRNRTPEMLRRDLTISGKNAAKVRADPAAENSGTRVSAEFQFTKGDTLMGFENDPFVNDVDEIAVRETAGFKPPRPADFSETRGGGGGFGY